MSTRKPSPYTLSGLMRAVDMYARKFGEESATTRRAVVMDYATHMQHQPSPGELVSILQQISKQLEKIMVTQTQHAADLAAATASLGKIGGETTILLQKVTDLETALAAGGNTTPEVDAAMDALKAQAQVVDDMVPDAAPPAP